jgi:preprotein translocase subunit SecG
LVYFLYALFFISCIVLIASVLLQPGKTDAGALFTSNISSTAFQPRGAQTILSKITIAAATVFMLSALFLALPALTGNVSVLQTTSDNSPETAPVLDSNTNSNSNTNANAATVINANIAANTAIVINSNDAANANSAVNVNIPADSNSASKTVNIGGNTNANKPGKIDEPKPAEKEPANK